MKAILPVYAPRTRRKVSPEKCLSVAKAASFPNLPLILARHLIQSENHASMYRTWSKRRTRGTRLLTPSWITPANLGGKEPLRNRHISRNIVS